MIDRLSELPHSLILHILSLLPMRDVVSTTLVSKHWNNLWTTVPCLNFSESLNKENGVERARNFVNRALVMWKGVKILKFGIVIEFPFDMSLARDVDLWVLFAVENEVEELSIELEFDEGTLEWENSVPIMKDVYRAPLFLRSCLSLKKLSLVGFNVRISVSPAWDQLKSLKLDGFCFSEGLVKRIMLGCPQLEDFELRLLEGYSNLNIQSTSLKKVKIEKYLIAELFESSLEAVLRICCPKLEKLEIYGVSFRRCLFKNVSSLTEATIGFNNYDYFGNDFLGETVRRTLRTIKHVERLGLSFLCAQELGASHNKAMLSPLPNVKFLKLIDGGDKHYEVEIRDTMNLLGIFPNLKTLVIEDEAMCFYADPPPFDLEFGTNISNSFLMQLKTIRITSPFTNNNSSIFDIIEFLLKYASALEKMAVLLKPKFGFRYSMATFSRVTKKLLSMPRSSPIAKVIFDTN